MIGDADSENTYIIDSESAAEMARLIDQAQCMNGAMGDLLPQGVDLTTDTDMLDVACGPGVWAQEVAFAHSRARVVGIDISPTMIAFARQRAQVALLDNVRFQVMDVRAPLAFDPESFDLVNARFMAAFLPRNEWPGIIKEFARITRVGGTIVLTETDIFSPDNTNSPALEEWNALCREAVYRAGLYTSTGTPVTSVLEALLQEAGCQNIRHRWHSLDFSAGASAHKAVCDNLRCALKLVQPFLLHMVQTTQEHLDTLYEQGLVEMMQDNFHGYTRFMTAWGTRGKPFEEKK
jgi:ubiquinone/menaquinone biosynthesis C-methylase UbiE